MAPLILLAVTSIFQEPYDPAGSIRDVLAENFRLLNEEEREAMVRSIGIALSQLTADPTLRRNAITHIRDCVRSGTVFLKSTDEFREAAQKYPQLLPLVLPDEYHRAAYEAVVQRIVADFAYASRFNDRDPKVTAAVGMQIETLGTTAKEIVRQLLTGIQGSAAQIACKKIDRIISDFQRLKDDPLFWMEKPLDEASYISLLSVLRENFGKLPILIPGEEGANPGVDGDTTQPVTDASQVESLIDGALAPLCLYPRYSRPKSYEARQKIGDLESHARNWMEEARLRHGGLYAEVLRGKLPKMDRRPPIGPKTDVIPRHAPDDTAPAPPEAEKAPRPPATREVAIYSPVWVRALLVLLIMVAISLVIWRACFRIRTPGKTG